MDHTLHADSHGHHDHHEPGFLGKYFFSTDHKVVGIQYAITALLFLLFGFFLMLMMRWQLAYPGHPIPVMGKILSRLLGEEMASKAGVMSPDLYNSFGAMHGTIM